MYGPGVIPGWNWLAERGAHANEVFFRASEEELDQAEAYPFMKPIFGEGENREKMLKALNFYKDLVESGAAPQRVATIVTWRPTRCMALRSANAAVSAPGWFG